MIRAAVIGSPISHSLSPVIHNRAYKELGIEGRFEAIEVKSGELANFFTRAKNDGIWRGFSLTMPLKEEVIGLADSVDPAARQIGSANYALFASDSLQKVSVSSTDTYGFTWVFKKTEALGKKISTESKVSVIGAGATARAAIYALDGLVSEIEVISRSAHRESALHQCVTKSSLAIKPWAELSSAFSRDLIINTTPKETTEELVTAMKSSPVRTGVLIDAIYAPAPRATLAQWRTFNLPIIDGVDLLIAQALPQIKGMTGKDFDFNQMYEILRREVDLHLAK